MEHTYKIYLLCRYTTLDEEIDLLMEDIFGVDQIEDQADDDSSEGESDCDSVEDVASVNFFDSITDGEDETSSDDD